MLTLFELKDSTGSMSTTSWTSTPSSFWPKAGLLMGGGRRERICVCLSGVRLSGNWMVRSRNRLPWMKGFLYVGMPSPLNAFSMRRWLLAFGSATTYMVQPFLVLLAARISSRGACLKYARPPEITKTPTSMPLRLSCVSQAFLRVSTSVLSACATKSRDSQSQSSKTSHSIFEDSSARGSKPRAMGLTSSPGAVFTRSLRSSRCLISSSTPQSASTREILRSR
mmetsp:Transcript_50557/g.159167  ORF Transcript_50557/g.159167 Transcript_50557/m.159167 type:complete len:224 (+) Transcript_50557:163-834(+)